GRDPVAALASLLPPESGAGGDIPVLLVVPLRDAGSLHADLQTDPQRLRPGPPRGLHPVVSGLGSWADRPEAQDESVAGDGGRSGPPAQRHGKADRKSTRLNSSHDQI